MRRIKDNFDSDMNIGVLKMLEPVIKNLLQDESNWDSLDVDYFPPRVERLYAKYGDYRIFLHVIHKPNEDETCLYHKHRWAAAFKMLKGSYEMGITHCEDEITSDVAHFIPDLAKFIIAENSYYEMTQTDALHYVKPVSQVSYSIMATCGLYPEAVFRKEVVNKELQKLSDERKSKLLCEFRELLNK